MATSGLYGSSPSGATVAAPGSESAGLYGNTTTFGGTYFEWFIFIQSATQPATPTGGSWSFTTNSGTPPTGWSVVPPSAPTLPIWVSIALVSSRNTGTLTWSAPGLFAYASGLPILSGSGAPSSGDGLTDQLYIQTGTTPETIWFKQAGTWTRLTGSTLYVDLTTNQTIAGTKTFSSQIQGSVSGTAANVTGIVDITNGGTGSSTASGARTALGVTATGQDTTYAYRANNLSDLASASTARTNLGLGSAAVLTAGAANGVATLDAGGTVPLSQIPASIQGGVSYQGTWNATTNTPTLTSSVGTKGYYYVVSVAGSTNLNGITSWNIGDWAIYNGTAWEKIDNTDAVTSVNGYTGTVVLNAADVGAISAITSTDGSVTITPSGTSRDLSVATAGATTNVICQVRNATGATLTKGTVVYITGATGQLPTVSKAIATGDATSAQTLGMMTADLANNSNGYVTIIGLITNIDTSAYTDGAQLYLSGTTAGAVTATKPSAPIHLVYVAVVEYAHPVNGKLFVKVQNGYELDEIHDVQIVSPTTGQTLVYNASTSLWNNSNAPVISGTTINNTTIGATTASSGAFTTLAASGAVTLSGGTANGVTYLNGSKVLTSGSALTFDGSTFRVIGTGSFGDGTNGQVRLTSSGSANYLDSVNNANSAWQTMVNRGVQFNWYTAASGTPSSGMLLDSSGNLLVGTTTPTLKLTVNSGATGGVASFESTDTVADIYLKDTNTLSGRVRIRSTSNNLVLMTNQTERARIDSSGNVGIGTSSPSNKLVVSNAGANGLEFNPTNGQIVTYNRSTSAYSALTLLGLSFTVQTGASPANRLTVDSSGNVGIGTSSPGARLHSLSTSAGAIATQLLLSNADSADGTGAQIVFSAVAGGTTPTGSIANVRDASGAYSVRFSTFGGGNNTERMRLDSAGNLGLGVTPSAWRSGASALQLGTTGYASLNEQANGSTSLNFNCFESAANTWTYRVTGVAPTRYTQLSGAHNWFTAATGTAGNPISFTQAMTLGADGNLLVGTTTNTNTSKLVVNGTISQTVGGTQYLVVDQSDIGTGANEIPLNQYLGNLAYEDNTNLPSVGVGSGTAALPSIFNATDNDTGFWFPAANTLAASVNGAEQLRLNATGLGIGTSSPDTRLVSNYGSLTTINTSDIRTISALTLTANDPGSVTSSSGVALTLRPISNRGAVVAIVGYEGSTNKEDTGVMAFLRGGSAYPSTMSESMRIDNAGNLGIGTSSPGFKLDVNGSAGFAGVTVFNGGANTLKNTGELQWKDSGGTAHNVLYMFSSNDVYLSSPVAGSSLIFRGVGYAERARIDSSGNLLVGTTSSIGKIGSSFINTQYGITSSCSSTSGTAFYHRFLYNTSTETGTISSTGTVTVYATTSDYRAKNITGSLTGYKERLMSLQPKQGTWIVDGSEFRGFLAHEFATPYRASVTGEKDAVDENGNVKMQSMQASSSEVMADLVALVQEQQAIIESLKARLDAANL